MSTAAARARWAEILSGIDQVALGASLRERMKAERLTFGGRLLCSSLRPFFIHAKDEARIARAAETLAAVAERTALAALEWPELLEELGPTPDELRLIRIDPGYQTVSTSSRADAFLLPDSLQFAEYNAESPGGPGFADRLAAVFDETEPMARLRETFDVRRHPTIERLLDALLTSYREWGGRETAPSIAIVDWREVPTWNEFEVLRDGFIALGVPTRVVDPRDLTFDGRRLAANGEPIDLVFRRVLVADIVDRPDECRALVEAYECRAVCVANSLRCKLTQKKTLFAVLTDDRFDRLFAPGERAIIRQHVPWTRRVRAGAVSHGGGRIDLLEYARANRERLVLKPSDEYGGKGVHLGWEATASEWDAALDAALADTVQPWILQERIAVLREPFPVCGDDGVSERNMLVDLAPFLFRGRLAGYLTRLSASGLANVTSGGGQAPAFVIREK
ncbi:MAG TPA: hypothetical protein VNK41_00240 [Vicinamibacterales bacterium]|nr:hypothetical protein [Vicinamibacterales bacterium]